MRTQDTSSRCLTLSYSYMVASATNPPLLKSWCSFGVYWILFANLLSLWETHSILAFIVFGFCKLSVKYHPRLCCLSQASPCPKTCSSCPIHVHQHKTSSSELWGPETPVSKAGDSGLCRISALSHGDSGTPETPVCLGRRLRPRRFQGFKKGIGVGVIFTTPLHPRPLLSPCRRPCLEEASPAVLHRRDPPSSRHFIFSNVEDLPPHHWSPSPCRAAVSLSPSLGSLLDLG